MPVGTLQYPTEAERVAIERVIGFVAQFLNVALAVPPGHVAPVAVSASAPVISRGI